MKRIFVLLCLLALFGSAMAHQDNKQDKNGEETDLPAAAPIILPTSFFSQAPLTQSPSSPSTTPTVKPTSRPSISTITIPVSKYTEPPTASPSMPQTEAPIEQPYMSPVITPESPIATLKRPKSTVDPSGAPVAVLSASPAGAPTISPAPSRSVVLTKVFLPVMEIGFTVDGEQVIEEEIAAAITVFIEETVVSNANILGMISSVEVNVKVSPAIERRRLREIQMVAVVDGFTYFEGDTYPSTDRLAEVLKAYFANWGDTDLEDYLSTDDVRMKDVEVILNGEFVKNVNTDPTDINQSIPQEESGMVKSPPIVLIAGVSFGCVAFVAALALVFYQRRKHGNQSKTNSNGKKEYLVLTPLSSPSRSRSGWSEQPHEIDPPFFAGGADEQSMSGISIEDYLCTSNTQKTPELYDTKRLDKVFSNALEFVERHQEENSAYVPSDEEVSNDSDFIPSD
jgi:hypothetical protein